MACLMMMPALSISFLESPDVMQTFNAGWSSHPTSFAEAWMPRGILFSLVIITPLASAYRIVLAYNEHAQVMY